MRITGCWLMTVASASETARRGAALLGGAEGAAGLLLPRGGRRRAAAHDHLHAFAQPRRLDNGVLAVAETGADAQPGQLAAGSAHPDAPAGSARGPAGATARGRTRP